MIGYAVRDHVAEILFDNPPVNALTDPFMDRLVGLLGEAGRDPGVRAVIIGSAIPGRFCAGLDLPAFLAAPPEEARRLVGRIYVEISEAQARLGKPCIAAIAGAARGAGMSIAITCDMILAAEDATFGYPELEVGLLPGIHYVHLHRIIGRHRAFDLLFTGRSFSAAEAMSLGLVSRVVPEAALLDEARKLAAVFARKSPALMRIGREAFLAAVNQGYAQGAAGAVELIAEVLTTADSREGLTAFAEKRRPVWGQP